MSDTMFLGHNTKTNEKVLVNLNDLTTHFLVVGRTGSGKTGLVHVLIEEAVMSGVSTVVLDPKGDLTNLALSFPNLTPEEFSPWVPEDKDVISEAQKWKDGITNSGQELSRVSDWHTAADVAIYTPGLAEAGQPINLLPSFEAPTEAIGEVALRERAYRAVTSVLSTLGLDADPMTDPGHVFLTEILLNSWKNGEDLPLEKWSGLVVTPPSALDHIDGIGIEDFFPHRERMRLARSLIGFRRQAARWLEGAPLNMEEFFTPTETVFLAFLSLLCAILGLRTE